MKINFILPGLGDSGGIRVVEKYLKLLSEHGHDVYIYSSIRNNNLHRYDSVLKNKIHQWYCTIKTLILVYKKKKLHYKWVWKIDDRNVRDADVVIATMWATAYDVTKLSLRCGEKYYFIQDYEVWDNKILGENSYKLPLNKIVISTWINKQLKKDIGIGPFPIVYNGIDKKYICNKKLQKNNNSIICLMLNHTLEKKGVEVGLKAYYLARNKYKNIRLIMFGMCDNSNLPKDIEYYRNPELDTLLELYRKADIFIFPSLDEGWGLTPIEAMANKCALVASNTGFVLDIGDNNKNMMISRPGDFETMAYNIVELAKNKGKRDEIAEKGYKCVLNMNWNKSVEALEKLIK